LLRCIRSLLAHLGHVTTSDLSPLLGKPDIEPASPNDRVWTHKRHWLD
jgi:hypothetical protein